MRTQFNSREAQAHLSRLIEQVEASGEAVMACVGKPVVRLLRGGEEVPRRRMLGRLERPELVSKLAPL